MISIQPALTLLPLWRLLDGGERKNLFYHFCFEPNLKQIGNIASKQERKARKRLTFSCF
jgi:hypothetical protein